LYRTVSLSLCDERKYANILNEKLVAKYSSKKTIKTAVTEAVKHSSKSIDAGNTI
jgi:hypothetical protein